MIIIDEKYNLNRILVLILLVRLQENNFSDIKSICKLAKTINILIDKL